MSDNDNGGTRYLTVKLPRRAYPILQELKFLVSKRTGEPAYNTELITNVLQQALDHEKEIEEK